MSSCYCDYDAPEFYIKEIRKARKQRKCYECGRSIETGERYEHVRGKWDGDVASYDTCPRCLDLRIWTERNIPCVCWAHGNILDDAREAIWEAAYHAPDETKGLRFEFLRKLHHIRYHGLQRYRHERRKINDQVLTTAR